MFTEKKSILLLTKATSFKEGADKLATSVAISQNFNLDVVTFTKDSTSSEYLLDMSKEWEGKVIPVDFKILNRTLTGIHSLEKLLSNSVYEAVFVSGSFGSEKDKDFVYKFTQLSPYPVVVCNNAFVTMNKKSVLVLLNASLSVQELLSTIVSLTENKLNCYDFLFVETTNALSNRKAIEKELQKLKNAFQLSKAQFFYEDAATLKMGVEQVLSQWNYDFFGFVTPLEDSSPEQKLTKYLFNDIKQSLISFNARNRLKSIPEVGYSSGKKEHKIPRDKTNKFITINKK